MPLTRRGDNTYSNYQEAQRAFWRQTVLPLVNRTARAVSAWLAPAYGGGLALRPDLDQVEALSGEREALWRRLQGVSFLTDDEKRAAIGYGPKGAGGAGLDNTPDLLPTELTIGGRKFNPYHDEIGRFTTAEGAAAPGSGRQLPVDQSPGGDANDAKAPAVILVAENDKLGTDRYRVNLKEHEEKFGGHTFQRHVNISDDELRAVVSRDRYDGFIIRAARIQQGSFFSEGDAEYFVNETLLNNAATINAVVDGHQEHAVLNKRFGSVTGKEAFRFSIDDEVIIRPVYAVRVVIERDRRSATGFRVLTAFPRNQLPGE